MTQRLRLSGAGSIFRLPSSILNDPVVRDDPLVSRLSGEGAPLIQNRVKNDQVIAGYTLIQDINTKPVMVLEVDTPGPFRSRQWLQYQH